MTRRVLLVAVLLTAVAASGAAAKPYVARGGKVMVGVTGGRTAGGYERAAGRRPAVFQFFVAWGDRFKWASLNRDITAYRRPVYVRLFSEMNNAANPYSAYDRSGRPRGAAHAQYWFKQAWRRVDLVLKGGGVRAIDRRLRRLGMPVVRGRSRGTLAHPRVKMLAHNQGDEPTSVFRLYRYPRAARVMRHALKATRFTSRVTTP